MQKVEGKETRYYIDIDLENGKVIGWDYDQRGNISQSISSDDSKVRIFVTKGQYKKLKK